jgi:hypothetical protein
LCLRTLIGWFPIDESPIDRDGQQIQILSLSHDANNDVCYT